MFEFTWFMDNGLNKSSKYELPEKLYVCSKFFSLTGRLIELATMKKTLLTLKTENYLVLFYVTLFTEKKEVINGGH